MSCDSYEYDNETTSTCSILSNMDTFQIQVFELNDLYCENEEVILSVYNRDDKLITTQTGQEVFLKEKSIIGRKDFHDIQVADPYMDLTHCQLDWTNWFKKTMPWVKEYSCLLRIRRLPISLCRYIAEFLKEPRCITFTDLGSCIGSLVAMKPRVMVEIVEGQSFRLGEKMDMRIQNKDIIALEEEDTVEDLQNKINKTEAPGKKHIIQDNLGREEGEEESKVYHTLSLELKFKTYEVVTQDYKLVSNKQRASFLIGSSLDANIGFDHDCIDQYQCEVILENGEWYINEWVHQDKKKRTWLNIGSVENKQYKITEDTDIIIGSSTLQISFPKSIK